MQSFAELLNQGAGNAWLFVPSAILLGALHGLEPGHSKTMMAAFIVAIRGTVAQAVLLGVAATFSHTLVVWVIAIGGMYIWRGIAPETFEPYLQLVSAAFIILIATWMFWRTYEDQQSAKLAAGHSHGAHGHGHSHGHSHDHSHGYGHGRTHAAGHAHPHTHSHPHPHSHGSDSDSQPHEHSHETTAAGTEGGHSHEHAHAAGATHSHSHDDHHGHHHDGHSHSHAHDDDTDEQSDTHGDVRLIDTGHGVIAVELVENDVPVRWRIETKRGHRWKAADVALTTERPDGTTARYTLVEKDGTLESVDEVPEPHSFMVRISLGHGNHTHDYDLSFVKGEGHDHMHEELRGLEVGTDGYQDAHELAHANDIRRRFADRNVTTWQIILFGLTGGLIPCPAAITVLLLCLQLKEITLGFALVLCFSIGLAVTLVTVGAVAALSVRHVGKRVPWFSTLARKAPYVSSILIIAVGLYVGWHGYVGLTAEATPALSEPAEPAAAPANSN